MQTVRASEIPLSRRSSCRAAWNVWPPGPGREIVEAYSIPTDYFQVNGSHTFLVSEDHTFGWPNAGSGGLIRIWARTRRGGSLPFRQLTLNGWFAFLRRTGISTSSLASNLAIMAFAILSIGSCCLATMNATWGPWRSHLFLLNAVRSTSVEMPVAIFCAGIFGL